MFRLKAIYAILISTLFFLFHILYLHNKIPYIFVDILFLIAALAGCLCSNVISYLLIIFSWVILYPLFTFIYKINPSNSFLSIFVFNFLFIGFVVYKNFVKKDYKIWDSNLKKEEGDKKILSEESKKLARFENGMKEKELTIVNLYDITKKMSEYLKFEDIFGVFSSFLKENFAFRKCDLLILNWETTEPRLDRTYKVWREIVNEKPSATTVFNYDNIVKFFLENPREVYISKNDDRQFFKNLGVKDETVDTFAGVPLLSEKKVVAILTIENLPREDLERFVILSMQFALEIKKVLLYETVEKLAITDSLTGLYTRHYFSERLVEELKRSKTYKFRFSFLMVDVDDFKRCNDTYGHLVGDVALKEIARLMKENVREIDLVARYGGEEFALVLPETEVEGAKLVAERIRKRIEENIFKAYDESLKLTISIGISVYPRDAVEVKGIIEKADAALYTAKKSGKNIACGYKK